MITFLHSILAALILAAVLIIWLGTAIDNLDEIRYEILIEPWYKRLWRFLKDWKKNYIFYPILWGIILSLYWVMQGILRII